MQKSAAQLALDARELIRKAEDEGRDLTSDEKGQVGGLLDLALERKSSEDVRRQVEDLSRELGPQPGGLSFGGSPSSTAGPGDQFIESKGYKDLMSRGLGSGAWSTGEVELEAKTVLQTTPGTALTPAGYESGIVETLFQRPYVADLMPNPQAPGNPVRFVSETTATNAAAAVAEAAVKPESTLVFGETSEPVRKVATILPVSDEMLEDAPQISAYLNQRLQLFVGLQEEAQLLLGSGTAPNLQGFVATGRAIGTFTRSAGTSNEMALFRAMNGARGSSFLEPDAIVIHPSNWLPIRAGTDASGQYYGGGPFYGPYGGPQGPAGASQFSADNLWGVRVLVTSAITVGTALIGSFGQGAALYRKGGLRVEASNSHGTYFASDITTLRAESRAALAVFRPSAFCAVVGLST